MFIELLFDPDRRFFYFAWVLALIISITLHELAHGWMAIRHGDSTPIDLGRMTGNPLVHMGPFSLIALFIFGIAWGQMPIQPDRLHGRHAEAKVAAAGPLMNLAIAIVCLLAYSVLLAVGIDSEQLPQWYENLEKFLFAAGVVNTILLVFNLLPAPPLDGSHILADFHKGYRRFISDPSKQGVFMLMFIGAFVLGTGLWPALTELCVQTTHWLAMQIYMWI